jgi:hypothetical protein
MKKYLLTSAILREKSIWKAYKEVMKELGYISE